LKDLIKSLIIIFWFLGIPSITYYVTDQEKYFVVAASITLMGASLAMIIWGCSEYIKQRREKNEKI
jgi:hypothetical protein